MTENLFTLFPRALKLILVLIFAQVQSTRSIRKKVMDYWCCRGFIYVWRHHGKSM